jgi:putative ABC transport system permease protein
MVDSTRAVAVFRRLVRLFLPAGFRRDHEDDLASVFGDLLEEARAVGGSGRTAAVWLRELAALLRLSWRLRRGARTRAGGRRWGPGAGAWMDMKLGLRMLVKQPGLTLVAVFSLAVGIPIGLVPDHAASALQAPLPVAQGDRIQVLRNQNLETGREVDVALRDFVTWREELTSFEALAATTRRRSSYNIISEDGRAAPAKGAELTASAFDILRVAPQLGRTLLPADEVTGAPNVVVIGHDFWRSRLNGDPNVVGQSIQIGGVRHSVVGVMPKGFLFPYQSQLWTPLRVNALAGADDQQPVHLIFGRLSDGVSINEAQAEVATAGARLAMEFPDVYTRLEPEVVPFAMGFFELPKGGFHDVLEFRLLQFAALLVLIIACANVGMLTFTRTTTRAGELAVRTALGASRSRIISQLFMEALIFAVLAAGTGLLVGSYAAKEFDVLLGMLPYWVDFGVTGRTVAWALSLAVLSAGVVGVVPALKVTGKHVQQNIQRATAGRSGVRFGGMSSALIMADVTLAVVTVAVAVGLSDSVTEFEDQMPIAADQYLSASVSLPGVGPMADMVPSERAEFQARLGSVQRSLIQRLKDERGGGRVAVASSLPGTDHLLRVIEVDGGDRAESPEVALRVWTARVDADFFTALEQPILAGRGFHLSDLIEPRTSIIVNTDFVDRVLGGRNAIGRRVRYAASDGSEEGPWFEIVGVVGLLGMSPGGMGEAGMYHPLAPGELHPIRLAIFTGRDPASFTPRLRALAGEVDPTAIITDPLPLDQVFSLTRLQMTWIKRGTWTLVGVLLALSISGVYALMSFTVGERTREIGIRAALGARPERIVLTIARRSLVQLGVGLVLGLPVAWRILFEMKRDLGRLSTHSPAVMALGVAIGVLTLIGLLACVAPTRRALKIMPTEALHGG